MAKKSKSSKKEEIVITTTSDEMKRLIKVSVVVIIIFAIFLGITYVVTKEEKQNNNDYTAETEIQYDEIIVGEILNQNNNEYYVLVTKEKDSYVQLYNSYISIYKGKTNALSVYNSNLDNVFNKKYNAEESDFTIAHIKDIRFSQTTLLKVKNKQITNSYEGKETIVNHLKELVK